MDDVALLEAVNTAKALLAVEEDDGSDVEPIMGFAPTDLIKKFEAPISAVTFYKLMIQKNLMAVKTRPSETQISGKEYRELTDIGKTFGYNEKLTHGGVFKGYQPRFYQETFPTLVGYLLK